MKEYLLKTNHCTSFILFLLINYFGLSNAEIIAQSKPEMKGMTLEQYDAAKKIQIKDLEKDTYVKYETSLIADRYEMKPPYVFNFSDGAERKIYLYKISDATTKNMIGMLSVYQNVKSGKIINLCIPSTESDKAVWGKYIDDIKDADKTESGFASCATFALSREFSSMLNPNADNSTVSGDEYEFCFPGEALVSLSDGNTIAISKIKKGAKILSVNEKNLKITTATVHKVIIHNKKSYGIYKIATTKINLTASLKDYPTVYNTFKATGNHPVLTANGIKKVKELVEGDIIYQYNEVSKNINEVVVSDIEANQSTTNTVYNLKVDKKTFIVNGITVLEK